jgi:predicted secreted acid phosphatase
MKKQYRCLLAVLLVLALGLQARAQEAKPSQQAGAKPKACVIDMDGTIADETARRAKAEAECPKEKDSKGYYNIYFSPDLIAQDKPIEKSREVLNWVSAQGVDIYYVSSRSQKCLKASMKWLEDNKFPKGKWVYHRKGFKKSLDYKTDTIKEIQQKSDVLFGVGDRGTDTEAYTNCGVKAITVEANSNKDWERVKTEIEKILAEKK